MHGTLYFKKSQYGNRRWEVYKKRDGSLLLIGIIDPVVTGGFRANIGGNVVLYRSLTAAKNGCARFCGCTGIVTVS